MGGDTNWARCNNCGMGYKMFIPTDEETHAFYVNEYREESNPGGEYPSAVNKRTQVVRIYRQMALVFDDLKHAGTYLDIGCGLGWSVRTMRFLEMDAYGVEPGKADRDYAKKHFDIDLYESLDDLPDVKMGLVIMSHVLEHIPDPVEYLTALRERYMKPDGVLVIEVPSMRSGSAWSAFHLVAFTPEALHYTVKQAGFDVEKLIGEGFVERHDKGLIWAVGRAKDGKASD